MAIIRRTDRGFASQEIRNLDQNIDDAFQSLLDLRRVNCPEWTDENRTDLGVQLLWLYAVKVGMLFEEINWVSKNCYLQTVVDRMSLKRLLDLIGYSLGQATPASVIVTFALEDGHPEFTIPQGTQVSTEETPEESLIMFETSEDMLVVAGVSTIEIVCLEGQTISNEILGSSDGSADQSFEVGNSPAIWESETIEIYTDGVWVEWTRVDDFVDSESTSLHYRVELDSERKYYIVFGDGINGKIPETGTNNIRCTYRIGGGSDGNVSADTIVELVSNIDYIDSVTNNNPASGGADWETIEQARKFAPASLRSLNRAVCKNDFKTLTEAYVSPTYGAIAKACIQEQGLSITVRIVPASGGQPSDGLKSDLQDYLDSVRLIGTYVEVDDPVYQTVNIDVDIYIKNGYNQSTVVQAVRSALSAHLSPTYQDPTTKLYTHEFGRDVYLSDLYDIIDGIEGVDHSEVTTPSGDVEIEENEIVAIGTLDITAYQGGDSYSYLDLET